jgi:hypothetical protein
MRISSFIAAESIMPLLPVPPVSGKLPFSS